MMFSKKRNKDKHHSHRSEYRHTWTPCAVAMNDEGSRHAKAKCTSSTMGGHRDAFINLKNSKKSTAISCGKLIANPEDDLEYLFYKWIDNHQNLKEMNCGICNALLTCSCKLQHTIGSSTKSLNPCLCVSNSNYYMQLENLYSGLLPHKEMVFLDYKIGKETATRADKSVAGRFRHRIIDSESTSRDLHYRLETFDVRNNSKVQKMINNVPASLLLLHRRKGAILDLNVEKRRKLHVLLWIQRDH